MKTTRSKRLFERAQRWIPGGVNSPVRAFRSVGGEPLFLAKGRGCKVTDVDGNEYIDYVGSWGPLILGHADPAVLKAIRTALKHGTSFGAPTELEVELAQKICKIMPSIEKVRMVSSGTEATMSAIRLARAATGRKRILKFEGCYHGHADSLLVSAGSGVATLGIPDSPGVPTEFAELTLTVPYNDLAAVRAVFARWASEIACIIVEPVAGNMGCVPPMPGFLEGLRAICDASGALLIFDEVMTGFRVAYGGAQQKFGIRPDLTCLGKVVGGGLPAAAYGGRAELMNQIAPAGPVYQAGTLSGNPLAMAAGLATLERLGERGVYKTLSDKASHLMNGLSKIAAEEGVKFTTASQGGMFGFFFHAGPVTNFEQAKQSHLPRFRVFFSAMLEAGVYLAPSAFESGFISLAHRERDLAKTLSAARHAMRETAQIH